MFYLFHIHYKIRKGLSAEFISKIEDVGLDDLPSEVTLEEAKQIAVDEFKHRRMCRGTSERDYVIIDIVTG